MKIVDVSEFYSELGGGVRSYVNQKLDLAAEAGHDLTIVAPGAENRIDVRRGGKIVWIECPIMPFDRNYRMFWRADDVWHVLDAETPDVVEGSSPWRGGWIAGCWAGNALKSLVFHQDFVAGYFHTFLDRVLAPDIIDRLLGWYWRYVQRLSARYDTTIVADAWLADRLENFGLDRPVVVPFGVERGRFSPAQRDKDLRGELLARCEIPDNGRLLLAVGRLHPEKRLGTVIDGFARAKAQRPLGLVIVGDGVSRIAVERHARRAGNVHMEGEIRDRALLARYYASADVLVHGSAAETYGLVVAEAICSGLPVVVPDRGGAANFASCGRSKIYATGDAGSCAAAILELLDRRDLAGQPGSCLKASPIGFLDEHFAALFKLYEKLSDAKRTHRGFE